MLKIRELHNLSSEERSYIFRRAQTDIDHVMPVVSEIVRNIKDSGDDALTRYVRELDFRSAPFTGLAVKESELDAAEKSLSADVMDAIRRAYSNIYEFHRRQMPAPLWFAEVEPGVFAGERATPIQRVALYVPGGKGFFPSVMLMLGVPAMVAGVKRIVVCTPPTENGNVDAAVLAAARLCGISEVYKMAGAQAIAALAYGTATVPRVDKIVGPCSIYAAAAKRLLSGVVDVGVPAGPSESIILADENPDPEAIALDLMIEAEHGPDSAATLVTHSRKLADDVNATIGRYVAKLPEPRKSYVQKVLSSFGGAMITGSVDESIAFVNEYAPEHLEVQVKDPFHVLWRIENAGEILLGPHTPISIANYCLGLNAILPTGGFAKSYSCVTVHDFLKRAGVGYLGPQGYQALQGITQTLANYEGFPAHALALAERPNGKR